MWGTTVGLARQINIIGHYYSLVYFEGQIDVQMHQGAAATPFYTFVNRPNDPIWKVKAKYAAVHFLLKTSNLLGVQNAGKGGDWGQILSSQIERINLIQLNYPHFSANKIDSTSKSWEFLQGVPK